MSVFKADCPHCGTRSVAFTISSERQAPSETHFHWETLAVCGNCDRGILANFESTTHNGPKELLNHHELEFLRDEGYLGGPETYPSTTSDEAPSHVPQNVKRFYEQGVDNLQKNWDASGSMFRKALEAALKNKFPDVKGDLYHRIEGAKKAGGLTAALA